MKIIEKQNFVRTEGDLETKKFGLIFNAKMVKLLSDSLYSNKILAIVRELSTNAYDSHVENGNPNQPFEVHLPSYGESFFYIRDYGTGLSPERIDLVYRHYGGSNRSNSNDYTGAMGLGSKTPFCYHTKSFTIESWCNGIHYSYAAYIGEDGIPCISKMSEEKSNEPSGVKIEFTTQKYDNEYFSIAAQNVYKYFSIFPIITGNKVEISRENYSICGKNDVWKLRSGSGSSRIIMGNVAYSIDPDHGNLEPEQKNILKAPFDIFVKMGEVSFDIGRENLSYDNRTKTKIRYYLHLISEDFKQQIETQINNCKNLWEARKTAAQIHGFRFISLNDLKYNGQKLFKDNYRCDVDFSDLVKNGDIEVITITSSKYRNGYEKSRTRCVYPSRYYCFFENDLKTGSFVRASHYSRNNDHCNIILVKFNTDTAKQSFIDLLGFDESYINKISSIPSPTIRTKRQSGKCISKVVRFNPSYIRNTSLNGFWSNEEDVDINTLSGIYVEFSRFSVKNLKGNVLSPVILSNLVEKLSNCGIKIDVLYGIKSKDIKKAKRNPNLINFWDYIIEQIENKLKTIDIQSIIFYNKEFHSIGQNTYRHEKRFLDYGFLIKIRGKCKTENDFTKFVDLATDYGKKAKDYNTAVNLRNLVDHFEIPIPENKILTKLAGKLDKMEKEVYNKYAMLGIVDSNRMVESNIVLVAQYVDNLGE